MKVISSFVGDIHKVINTLILIIFVWFGEKLTQLLYLQSVIVEFSPTISHIGDLCEILVNDVTSCSDSILLVSSIWRRCSIIKAIDTQHEFITCKYMRKVFVHTDNTLQSTSCFLSLYLWSYLKILDLDHMQCGQYLSNLHWSWINHTTPHVDQTGFHITWKMVCMLQWKAPKYPLSWNAC